MAQEGQEIAQIQSELLKAIMLCLMSAKQMNNNAYDYLTVLPVEPDKPYIELKRLLDDRAYQCFSIKDVERSLKHIINETDMYNNLVMNADVASFQGKADVKAIFTPDLFNKLGGQNSEILLNTMDIALLKPDTLSLSLIEGASQAGYNAVFLTKKADDKYNVEFVGQHTYKELKDIKTDDLKNVIKNEAQIKDKAYLDNKTGKKLFTEDEIPKDQLKRAGIKWSDLSETNKKALMDGKESSAVTISHRFNSDGKKGFTNGHLQLSRIGGNKAQFMFRPLQQKGMKKQIRFK